MTQAQNFVAASRLNNCNLVNPFSSHTCAKLPILRNQQRHCPVLYDDSQDDTAVPNCHFAQHLILWPSSAFREPCQSCVPNSTLMLRSLSVLSQNVSCGSFKTPGVVSLFCLISLSLSVLHKPWHWRFVLYGWSLDLLLSFTNCPLHVWFQGWLARATRPCIHG